MTRATVLRITLVCALLGLAVASPVSERVSVAQSEQIYLALGDSIPAGLLASLPAERGYPGLLQDLSESERLSGDEPGNVELINLAEPGETVQSFQQDGQLESAIEEIQAAPDGQLETVTLTLGGNNILALWESTVAERQDELERFESEFTTVIDQLGSALEDHDPDVVVTTYYDLTEGDPDVEGSNAWWLRQFNEVIAETASEAGFQVVDLESLFSGRVSELTWFPADIHPNNSGHQAIARAIWHELGYDEEPPEVEITRPDTDEARSRVPTIHAQVSDNVGIDTVILEVEDESAQELIYVPRLEVWVGLWDAREFPGNEATVTVVATDVSGNETRESVTLSLPSG
jgi:lysophospholipase L1-like esterase